MKQVNNSNKRICEEITKGNTVLYEKFLADNINWNILGNGTVSGKKNVIDTLSMSALENYPVITIKQLLLKGIL